MKKRMWPQLLLAGAFVVPLQSKNQWQVLKYSKIPANQVSFAQQGLKIQVSQSASPIIYPLDKASMVSSVELEGHFKGLVNLPKGKKQGEKGADDYPLRLGLVVEGQKTLNFFQRTIAANWVKTLFGLAPKGTGVDHIYFLNVAQQKPIVGTRRTHPLSELIVEKNQWLQQANGDFKLEAELKKPLKVLALWISSDGDDTQSAYEVLLTKIRLNTPKK